MRDGNLDISSVDEFSGLRSEPTYEGWKLNTEVSVRTRPYRSEPTYEGWKRTTSSLALCTNMLVPSLPMRDGNPVAESVFGLNCPVPSLPMRDGNPVKRPARHPRRQPFRAYL